MQAGEIYLIFTERFAALALDYIVTGSVASSSYGEPRFTHDIDVVLSIPLGTVDRMMEAFPLEEFYCPPPEVLREEIARPEGGQFNLVHHETGFKADLYVASEDELTTWALVHRRSVEILPGRHLYLAPPEYVILGKLSFHAEGGGDRHIRDIRSMLQVSAGEIDMGFLLRWIERMGVGSSWREVTAE